CQNYLCRSMTLNAVLSSGCWNFRNGFLAGMLMRLLRSINHSRIYLFGEVYEVTKSTSSATCRIIASILASVNFHQWNVSHCFSQGQLPNVTSYMMLSRL